MHTEPAPVVASQLLSVDDYGRISWENVMTQPALLSGNGLHRRSEIGRETSCVEAKTLENTDVTDSQDQPE